MASDVMSLFNMPTQDQLGRAYLEGMLTSPAQMNQLSLLQQVSALGGNAGAGLGYAAGRLMGGKTADQVRAQGIEDAMNVVSGMGLSSDAEMYGALSRELASRGLTQDALMARNTALKAAKEEQAMQIAGRADTRAQAELAIRQAADARAEQELPLNLRRKQLDIKTLEDSLKTDEEKLAEAALLVEQGAEGALPKYNALAKNLQEKKLKFEDERAKTQAQITYWNNTGSAAVTSANAAKARAEGDDEKFDQPVSVDVPSMIPGQPPQKLNVGWKSKKGRILGRDGEIYTNANEAAKVQNIGQPAAPVAPRPDVNRTNKTPQRPLGSFGG